MSNLTLGEFQEQVSELLLRHRSVLDILSKCDQSNASVHRSITKAITECGCIEVNGRKQRYSEDMTLEQARASLDTQLNGELCDLCAESVREQLGRNLFYMAALCNVLDIDLEQIMIEESSKCATLGVFKMA